MKFVMHVKGPQGWFVVGRSNARKGTDDYKYDTLAEAVSMLRMCYPDILREDRLTGAYGERARVVPEGTPLGELPKEMNDWAAS